MSPGEERPAASALVVVAASTCSRRASGSSCSGSDEEAVERDRTRLIERLGVDGFLGLTRWALREGIVSLDP